MTNNSTCILTRTDLVAFVATLEDSDTVGVPLDSYHCWGALTLAWKYGTQRVYSVGSDNTEFFIERYGLNSHGHLFTPDMGTIDEEASLLLDEFEHGNYWLEDCIEDEVEVTKAQLVASGVLDLVPTA